MTAQIALIAVVTLGLQAAQQPPRDAFRPRSSGTAVLSGVIRTDDAEARPVRGAIVTINHVDALYGTTVLTDAQGRFEIRGLPAGRYLVAAQKEGFLKVRYGAARPERAGTPIVIGEGARIDDLALRLTRAGAITGRVVGPDGEPAEDVGIELRRVQVVAGERRLQTVYGSGTASTDDRGIYRIWGLPPGDYVVSAMPPVAFHTGMAAVRMTTAADVAWARSQLGGGTGGSGGAVSVPGRPTFAFTPVFYPNVLQRASAAVVAVRSGEEIGGIDIALQLVPTSRVSVAIMRADGSPASQPPSIYLVEAGPGAGTFNIKEGSGARFTFEGVPPGSYAVAAMVESTKEWAVSDLAVTGQDASVVLTLQPPLTATGRVRFDGKSGPPPDPKSVRLWLEPMLSNGVAIAPQAGTVAEDGTFVVGGMMPGRWRLNASLPAGASRAGWTFQSATLGVEDIADIGIDVRAGTSLENIAVTFSDRPTQLGGQLQDATGRPAADYFIVVFSTDTRTWFSRSRRIAQTRPDNDGRFLVRALPPGDYYVAALTDVQRDEWYDPAFLNQLVPSAIRITLAEGENKTQDIRIR
jgi:uncharacterized protein (DUF2141 family)